MFYCGLDISLLKTSICIVDQDGAIEGDDGCVGS